MRHAEAKDVVETEGRRDFSLEGGCPLCGGNLDVRVTAGATGTVCKSCRWISRPHLRPNDEGVHVIHPAGGLA